MDTNSQSPSSTAITKPASAIGNFHSRDLGLLWATREEPTIIEATIKLKEILLPKRFTLETSLLKFWCSSVTFSSPSSRVCIRLSKCLGKLDDIADNSNI